MFLNIYIYIYRMAPQSEDIIIYFHGHFHVSVRSSSWTDSAQWLGGGITLGIDPPGGLIPQFFGVAVTLLCLFSYTCGGRGAVKLDLIQANSPRATVGICRITTPIMPNGHMRSCTVMAASSFSAWRQPRK